MKFVVHGIVWAALAASQQTTPGGKTNTRDEVREAARSAAAEARRSVEAARAGSSAFRDSANYRRAMSALDGREWEKAVALFTTAAQEQSPRADGAFYWKAYALNKLGRREEALAALAELQRAYANSRWLGDAKALEFEVRQSSGQPPSPEQESDEEIKLYALSGLVHSDPARALPLLEKKLTSAASPRMKERALFVMAQINTAEAREMLSKIAFGGANPDVQRRAVQFLGETNDRNLASKLAGLYASSSDTALKLVILHSLGRFRDRERLAQIASTETDRQLRDSVYHLLAGAGGQEDLWKLYGSASDEGKLDILRAVGGAAGLEKLQAMLRAENSPKLRLQIVRGIRHVHSEQAAGVLSSVYATEPEKTVRREILDGLAHQKAARSLIEIARRESDVDLKKAAVRALSSMKSKEASDYLLELLK